MGWAYGRVGGREVGYGVMATCDEPGCDAWIDRGLGYLCGEMHGQDDDACSGYFCGEHLYYYIRHGRRCDRCSAALETVEAAS